MKKKEKIYNLWNLARCIKTEISYDKHKFSIYIIQDSPVRCMGNKIVVTPEFLMNVPHKQQIAMFYHERYHSKFFTKIRKILNILRFFSFQKANWQEEFYADKYSAKIFGKVDLISFLKRTRSLYKEGKVKYDERTHPPIEERIKRLKEL